MTSSGTDIGKTYVMAKLCGELRQAGNTVTAVKPVISGFDETDFLNSDSAILLRNVQRQPLLEKIKDISPWRFKAPLSPDMAAREEGRSINFAELVRYCRGVLNGPEDYKLIEGIGGVMVPLDGEHTVLDWISALNIPVIVVVGSYLGTISHTLTAITALETKGIDIAEVVVSESPGSSVGLFETVSVLQRFLPAQKLRQLPRQDQ